MTAALALPLSDTLPETAERASCRIADLKVILNSVERSGIIENRVPGAPLLKVQEAQVRNVELVFEEPQIAVTMLAMSVRPLGFKQQIVVDEPVPADVHVPELCAQCPLPLFELPSHEA